MKHAAQIIECIRAGMTQAEAAKVCDCSQGHVCGVVLAHERETGEQLPRRKSGPHIGFRAKQARNAAIVADYAELRSTRAVAKLYGISQQRVHAILQRAAESAQ